MKLVKDKDIILKICIIFSLLGIIYFSNIKWLFHALGENDTFTYGYFIPFITAYMIYRDRDKILKTPLTGANAFVGLGIIIPGVLLQILCLYLDINTLSTYSLILILLGIAYYLFGGKIFSYLSFPICYLLFMVPLTTILFDPISTRLKYFVSLAASKIIYLSGVPIVREGIVIHLPNASLEVVDACSGIRSLLALLVIATFLVYLRKGSITMRVVLISMAIPIAVITNILRVLILCFLSEFYRNDIARNEFVHNVSGIMVFAAGLMMLILLSNIFLRWDYQDVTIINKHA